MASLLVTLLFFLASSLLWSGYRKEKGNVSQTTEEKIPWEGEFTIRSDP